MKHLLIDFENVHQQNLNKLATENTHIWLFLGVNHIEIFFFQLSLPKTVIERHICYAA